MDEKVSNNISFRRGNVVVSREMLWDYVSNYDNENPIFKDFVPVDVKYDFMTNTLKISGYSPFFRPLFEGEEMPDYEVTITRRVKQENVVTVRYNEIPRI